MRGLAVIALLAAGCHPQVPPGFHEVPDRANVATAAGLVLAGLGVAALALSSSEPRNSESWGPANGSGAAVLLLLPAVPLTIYGLSRTRLEPDE